MEYKLIDIVSEIEKRRDELLLSESEELEQARVEYLNEFFNKYNVKRITTLANMKPTELLLAYLLEQNLNDSFEQLQQEVSEVEEFIEKLDECTFWSICKLVLSSSKELLDMLIEINNKVNKGGKLLNYLSAKNKIEKIIKDNEIPFSINNNKDISDFINLVLILKKVKKEAYSG